MSQCQKCDDGWICETHPDKAWPHDDCPGPGMPCDEPWCEMSMLRQAGDFRSSSYDLPERRKQGEHSDESRVRDNNESPLPHDHLRAEF